MNVPPLLPRLVSAALVAAALIVPSAAARPADPDPPSRGEPGSVTPIDPSADTVVSSRMRRCGDVLVASGRLAALPSCAGGWRFDGGHQEPAEREDRAVRGLPCTPGCDPSVLAPGHAPAARGPGSPAASVAEAAFRALR